MGAKSSLYNWVWDYKYVGKLCREGRAEAGLTQEQVGVLLELSGTAYGAIENGNYKNMPKYLLDLANLFEFDPCEAMGIEPA